jgi:hypothetical protein
MHGHEENISTVLLRGACVGTCLLGCCLAMFEQISHNIIRIDVNLSLHGLFSDAISSSANVMSKVGVMSEY